MTIAGLTGRFRAPREMKLKLGYKKRGEIFPSDTDCIVAKLEDGVTKEVLDAYGAVPIPDAAEQGVYSLGRELRGLIPGEFDAVGRDGREVWLELLNRAWGKSRVRCSGDGGGAGFDETGQSLVGEAWVRDEAYAKRFRAAGLLEGDRPGGGWVARCQGPDCPLWHTRYVKGGDTLPGCHREMRLRFVLLHPSEYDRTRDLDQQDADYLHQLAVVEIATGSWNGAVDSQSGFAWIRAMAGKTAGVPFTLKRVRRSLSTPEGRAIKWPLMVAWDTDEAVIMGASGSRALLRPGLRQQLAALDGAENRLALPEPAYSDVEDIQPQQDRRGLPEPRVVRTGRPVDREDALDAAQQQAIEDRPAAPEGKAASQATAPASPTGPPAVSPRIVGRDELNALKRMCGGTPGQKTTLGLYRQLMEQAYKALGVPMTANGQPDKECKEWRAYPGSPTEGFPVSDFFTTRHRDWVHERLAERGQQTELIDEDDG